MSRLPKVFRRRDRPGYWFRDKRQGRDDWHRADTRPEAVVLRDRVFASTRGVSRVTVAEAARRWLELKVATSRNPAGLALAESRVEAELVPRLGMRPLAYLTADDCRAYRLAIETATPHGRRRAPQTVAHVLADFRAMLRWAEGERLLGRSPFPRGLLPRVADRAPDRCTDGEVAALEAIADPWGFELRLLFGTGVRWGEAVLLEGSHRERGLLRVVAPKTGTVRRVPLSPALDQEIAARVGRLVHLGLAQSLAVVARNATGIERFHVHQTRHTFACRWLERGGSLPALQEILGHSTVRTTQRYGRPSEESIQAEARRVFG